LSPRSRGPLLASSPRPLMLPAWKTSGGQIGPASSVDSGVVKSRGPGIVRGRCFTRRVDFTINSRDARRALRDRGEVDERRAARGGDARHWDGVGAHAGRRCRGRAIAESRCGGCNRCGKCGDIRRDRRSETASGLGTDDDSQSPSPARSFGPTACSMSGDSTAPP
jgi:hypothetical protein